MEPQHRSSFIPKSSLANKSDQNRPARSMGIVATIASIILVITFLVWVSMFGYTLFLQQRISDKGVQLKEARAAINEGQITQFKELHTRLNQIRGLVQNHRAASILFSYLQSATIQSIQFTSFEFNAEGNDGIAVSMSGTAPSINTVTLQSALFERGSLIDETAFSKIQRGDNGNITFAVDTLIDPSSIRYAQIITTPTASLQVEDADIQDTDPGNQPPIDAPLQ